MRILVLSFYYQPDLCAGSFRATALVKALQEKLPAGAQLDVLTTLPNRYSTFSQAAPESEIVNGVHIHRVKLPEHKSGMVDQSKAFWHFARSVLKLTKDVKYDLVVGTSSRLMTASLSAYIAHQHNAKLYLDIRDLFVDTVKDVLSRKITYFAKPLFSLVEYCTFNQANKINLVSQGFKPYFDHRYPSKRCSFFTNGIDEEFIGESLDLNLNPELNLDLQPVNKQPISILYAGNIGEGQGLHMIIPLLAQQMGSSVHFKLIGDGGRKVVLDKALLEKGLNNVEVFKPVNREQLIQAYQHADVLFLHLNDYEAFKKVLPSKIFEYAAMGKPIWAGVAGYAAEFIRAEVTNAAVFSPCDINEAKKSFSTLVLEKTQRNEFIAKFARINIMKKMADDILSLVR
ncbi:MAG: glycosyltransferase family 4 protein [Pseudomonadota bacterium]